MCQILVPTSTYPLRCRCNTQSPTGPSQTAAQPPVLPQARSRTSRRSRAAHEKNPSPDTGAPCLLYHNVSQCDGGLWVVLVQKAISFKEVLNRTGFQAGGATAPGNNVDSRSPSVLKPVCDGVYHSKQHLFTRLLPSQSFH